MQTKKMRAGDTGGVSLPLLHKKPFFLNARHYTHTGSSESVDFSFAYEEIAVPLGISEFSLASHVYPIVFSYGLQPLPFAIMGLKESENLFVDEDGAWKGGGYIPAYLRCYPFIDKEASENGKKNWPPIAARRVSFPRLRQISGGRVSSITREIQRQ